MSASEFATCKAPKCDLPPSIEAEQKGYPPAGRSLSEKLDDGRELETDTTIGLLSAQAA